MGCSNSQAAATVEYKKNTEENQLDKPISEMERIEMELKKIDDEEVDYLAKIGPEPEEFYRERVQFPGDENTLL